MYTCTRCTNIDTASKGKLKDVKIKVQACSYLILLIYAMSWESKYFENVF